MWTHHTVGGWGFHSVQGSQFLPVTANIIFGLSVSGFFSRSSGVLPFSLVEAHLTECSDFIDTVTESGRHSGTENVASAMAQWKPWQTASFQLKSHLFSTLWSPLPPSLYCHIHTLPFSVFFAKHNKHEVFLHGVKMALTLTIWNDPDDRLPLWRHYFLIFFKTLSCLVPSEGSCDQGTPLLVEFRMERKGRFNPLMFTFSQPLATGIKA